MVKYKRVDTANGRTMYFKNGKMVKATDIPAEILSRLEDGVELQMGSPTETDETVDQSEDNEAQLSQKELPKDCIFCGEPATRKRFVNLQIANLCETDYNNHTTGEIAAQIREVQNQE
jgi:hypothetical protein